MEYNAIGLTKKIARNGSTLAEYSYLADGARLSAVGSDGTGVRYLGSLIYSMASEGALSLDCALTPGGRIVRTAGAGTSGSYQVQHFLRDHLGSVRAVVDGATGGVLETSDYLPLGRRWDLTGGQSSQTVTDPTNRWRFSGKESQAFFDQGIPYSDFGARLHDLRTGRWLAPDPLAEKYYGLSQFGYCAGDPVKFIDDGGADLVLAGANKSSVTFKTDLVDMSINVGKIGIDWGGNYSLDGKETLSAALDLAGFLDPTGVADGANALLLASDGDYWGAVQSGLSILPLGDLAKAPKLGKDIGIISDAVKSSNKSLHRPYIRKWVREAVEANTKRDEFGRFIDPNTKEPIKGKYDLGHKKNNEFRKMKAEAESKGMTQKEFNDWLNDPKYYQIENPHSNRSHKFEQR